MVAVTASTDSSIRCTSQEKDLAMEKSLKDFPSNVRVLKVNDFDESSFDQLEPIIVRGAVARASNKWTDEWLLQRFGNDYCQVSLDSRPAIRGAYEKQMSLTEYLSSLESSGTDQPPEYLFHSQRDFDGALDLLEDIDVPTAILDLGNPSLYRFFVGPPFSGTLPHFHTYAINALARGRKRWAIYVCDDRRETNELLQESNRDYSSGSQARDWFALACPELRRRRRVRLWEFAQEAGDLVYIPAWFIHAVVNLEPVVGFTVEFQPQHALRGPMGARGPMGTRRAMGTRRPVGTRGPMGASHE
jgi:JmjC domain, hydroxylase